MNLAYVAGIVDGEGCIGFTKMKTGVYPRVLVTNTNLPLLESFRRQFGGDIKPLSLRKSNWKQGYSWRLQYAAAVNFVGKIYKWLRIKCNQALLLFSWDAIRPGSGGRWTQEGKDAMGLVIQEMKWLNKKGPQIQDSPIDIYLRELELPSSKL